MFLNFNFCQIISNTLVMIWGLFNLNGYPLYCMLFVTLLSIGFNLYVLQWSIKHKLYEAEFLLGSTGIGAIVKISILVFIFSIKALVYYFLVSFIVGIANYLIELSSVEFNEHFWTYTCLWGIIVLAFFVIVICGGLMHITKILATTDKLYPTETGKFISQFKLELNETSFCTSGHDVTGFISSGICCTEKGVVYKDTLLKKEDVINYLNAADIPFSALDDNHVKVLTMYNY